MKKTVDTYQELRAWVSAFARGHLPFLLLIGNPGLGKTRLLQETVGPTARLIEGRATAFQVYCELYRHRDRPFLIDDVDDLYHDRDAVRLLKCLCDSEPVKHVAWHSAARLLDDKEIPREFSTRTRVAVVGNEWKTLTRNIQAVEDRGTLVLFQPTSTEVHDWVATWYESRGVGKEVFQFVERHLEFVSEPSARHYLIASQLKRAGLDWRAGLRETWGMTEDIAVLAELLGDEQLRPGQRQKEFARRTGRSRAHFFRLRKRIQAQARGQ